MNKRKRFIQHIFTPEESLSPHQVKEFVKAAKLEMQLDYLKYEDVIKKATKLYQELSTSDKHFTRQGQRLRDIIRIAQGKQRKLDENLKSLEEV